MTQSWEFTLPNGNKMFINLQWKYVPYIDELRTWMLENWDVRDGPFGGIIEWGEPIIEPSQIRKENWRRFYAFADELVETGSKPQHPIGWVLDKTKEHLDEQD
jgi:hypothetical protein